MKSKFAYLALGLLLAIALPVFAAQQISVPVSPGTNYILQGLSTGNWSASKNLTVNGTTTLATTTTSVLNGVIVVDGVRYAATAAGINAAICAAVPTSGSSGEVDLPPGLDVLSASINYRCNQYRTGIHLKIKGAGIDTTILKLGNNVAVDPTVRAVMQGFPEQETRGLFTIANASSTIEISDMTLDYNGSNQTINIYSFGILGDNSFGSTYIHNVSIKNVFVPVFSLGGNSVGIGFDPYDARNVRFENNNIYNTDEGIWVTAFDNGIDVSSNFTNNIISSSTQAAIYDEAGSGVTIAFNYMASSTYGIHGPTLLATDHQSIVFNDFASTIGTKYNLTSTVTAAVFTRLQAGHGFSIPAASSLFFNSDDINWRIGYVNGVTNNFVNALTTTGIEITAGAGPTDGFSIGTEQGNSIAEFKASNGTSYFRNLVGVGTSSPFAKLSIQANASDTATTLFAIGSSTATATSTLFSISNTGSTTLFQLPSSLLKTDANGTIVAAVAGTDYAPAGNYATFAYPFLNSATSSVLKFSNGLVSNGSTTITGLASGLVGNNNGLLYGFASSSLFGTGTLGQMLVWANGVPSWMATSTFSTPFVFANNNITCTSAAAGVTGCLTGTDWNTFNGKDSFAYPFTPGNGFNSTTTGLMILASSTIGNSTQAGGLTISGGATTTGNAVVNGTLAVGKSLVNSPSSISTNGDIDVALASYTRYNSDGNWRIGGVTATAPTTRSMVSGNSLYMTGDSVVIGLNTGNSSLELNNSTGAAYIRGKVGIGTTTPATKLQVSSGASATTTVTVGELGLTSSKACVNMNASDGSASSFYINAAHALVVEANYCR